MEEVKIYLSEAEMPRRWYNIVADMPNKPAPPRHPATGEPVPPEAFSAIFPMNIIEQEISAEREIAIPEEVLSFYRMYRPTPLIRAFRFEKALKTPAKIFYKYEGASPAGSHKLNSAIAQVYYNKQAGTKRITTETGAGQWGSALAMACNFFGLECVVYMVRVSYNQKPYRRIVMETFGAKVHASPSNNTKAGREALAKDPNSNGSLGLAISEAVEDTVTSKDTKYSLGSVLNHVCLHQTVIGQEAKLQLAKAGLNPDVVIGCVGGGSNFSGLSFPFVRDKIYGKQVRAVACEPTSCPTLTRGLYKYDFGDSVGMTPLMLMYTLGHGFMPPGIHAGGLRYHGDAPLLSQLVNEKLVEAVAVDQLPVFQAAELFARSEGIIPAPESAHALAGAVVEADKARQEGKERVILIGLSGHGFLDLAAYDDYHQGKLKNFPLPQEEIDKALHELPPIPANK
ncbi:MAG TPA: TrpB-like pyridoxal phosphate-dependent enzyme [Candidatus Latescibacteria bacterium]|nr:TrpB-like pyridoxal phosphate-dependent enzyme [Candidatus Latescibacterota bacterium]